MQGRIYKREGVRGTSWYYVHDANGTTKSGTRKQVRHGGFQTKKAAQDALTTALSDLHEGSYVERSKITVSQFLNNEWFPAIEASGILKSDTHRSGPYFQSS